VAVTRPDVNEASIGERTRRRRGRRRPSGEAPPLPHNLERSGRVWFGAGVGAFVLLFVVAAVSGLGDRLDGIEGPLVKWIAEQRTDVFTAVMKGVNVVGSDWTVGVVLWAAIITLVAFKRLRHMLVFFGCLLAVGFVIDGIALVFVRARPFDVEIIGHWAGTSLPSQPMAALCVALMGFTYSCVVPGRARSWAKWSSAVVIVAYALARLYLGVDHPTDLIIAAVIAVSVPVVAFRWLTPNDVFPVTYERGKAAHLDVEGTRGAAIIAALESQLGLSVVSAKPFGLAGSGGSTPLKLTVADPDVPPLFAKLYASTHLRADRWYKLGRTLLYGRLEDEASFSTVRRLIQYEDYMLRVMRDAGLPTPAPIGIAEIVPDREYVLVTEFIQDGREIGEVVVTDAVIDNGLAVVRQLWDAGLAHRDIKPSNLLVRDEQVHLIDVAFGQVRPSPWRQAVDLANMMIVLAMRSVPEVVYERALAFFTPEEISEAFAATRSVTIPSQSRGMLKAMKRDIVASFRDLAPACQRVSIQRWSWRRIALTTGVLGAGFLVGLLTFGNLQGIGLFGIPRATDTYASVGRSPGCGQIWNGEQIVLIAQSVPSAERVPCLNPLPAGWSMPSFMVRDGRSEFTLESDRAVGSPIEVVLTASCDPERATRVPSDELRTDRYERIDTLRDAYRGTRFYLFEGGCVTYGFDFVGEGRTALAEQASLILSFRSREDIRTDIERFVGVDPF
jgi:tRNA A-37 threonylcarbamoyl transferase component Bud32/membrane-associated phospholipid phosphatase